MLCGSDSFEPEAMWSGNQRSSEVTRDEVRRGENVIRLRNARGLVRECLAEDWKSTWWRFRTSRMWGSRGKKSWRNLINKEQNNILSNSGSREGCHILTPRSRLRPVLLLWPRRRGLKSVASHTCRQKQKKKEKVKPASFICLFIHVFPVNARAKNSVKK